MCTITFYPRPTGYIITQNRDESPKRRSTGLQLENGLLFPRDESSKGTWIGIDGQGRSVALMNGAFKAHTAVAEPRASRGTIIPRIMQSADLISEVLSLDLEGIEPFTLILADESSLHCFRWDAIDKHLETLDHTIPHIWSSPSLYSDEWQERRKIWFGQWLDAINDIDSSDLRWFHNHGGEGNESNDLIMDRGHVRTTSITQLKKSGNDWLMRFTDLSTCLVEERRIHHERRPVGY